MNNIVDIYSNQKNSKSVLTVSDISTRKYDKIHKEMFNRALSKYMSTYNLSIDDYKVIELYSSYYDSPSKVQLVDKTPPYKRQLIDLTPYWESTVFTNRYSYKNVDEYNIQNVVVIYKDYVNGIARLQDKLTNKIYTIKLTDLPNNIEVSDKIENYKTNFAYKYNHKIFGI